MSLTPNNTPVKGTWLAENGRAALRANLWWIMYLFAALAGAIASWALFSPTTPA